MNNLKWISSVSMVICTLGVAMGFALSKMEAWSPVLFILGMIWLVSFFRRWNPIFEIAFVAFVLSIAYLTFRGFLPGLMLVSLVAALAAWDLNGMISRFEKLNEKAIEPGLDKRHLIRLAEVLGIGLIFGGAALSFRIHFSLVIGLLVVMVVFIGLGQFVLHLRRISD